jgi:hypothetical protein
VRLAQGFAPLYSRETRATKIPKALLESLSSSSWRIPTTSLSTTEGSAANANATAASDTPAETPLFSSSFSSVRPEPVLPLVHDFHEINLISEVESTVTGTTASCH